jgi:hypothetical protein
MEKDLWTYDEGLEQRDDLKGFDVEALDGEIGHVDDATYEVGNSCIVVDTGPWIFGKKVMIPASALVRIDLPNEKVFLRYTKEQIKNSPELSDVDMPGIEARERLHPYYAGLR